MFNLERIGEKCLRWGVLCVAAGLILAIPNSETNDFLRWKDATVALFVVLNIGKALYDTFFDERVSEGHRS